MEQLMKTSEVAEWLNMSEDALRLWRTRGIGPPWLKLTPMRKATVRYRRADVEAWLDDLTQLTE